MVVLSLFDGMSCGQLALQRAGIKVEKYYASEIDKYAIKITQKNFPNTIQLGDVKNWRTWIDKLPQIDLLIGGSPCQGFSRSGEGLNFEDPRSKLFFEYVDILNYCKPRYFLLENVKMKKEWQDIISSYLNFEPVKINSTLVSAQNRERLYWTNISKVEQPKDKCIYLKDIIEDSDNNITAIYQRPRGFNKGNFYLDKSPTLSSHSWEQNNLLYIIRDKSKCVRSGGRNSIDRHEWDSVYKNSHHRKLTVLECERLQTLPDNYTEGVSDTQRYKMIGNGWTVDVIAHIFSYLNIIKQAINL